MATSIYTLITQLVQAHFMDDNASFESILTGVIRLLSAEDSKLAKKNATAMADLLAKHRAGMSGSQYTRSVQPVSTDSSKFYRVVTPQTRLDDLVLPADVLDQVQSVILSRRMADQLHAQHIPAISKVIINGKPGTGKSSLAAAIANALEVPLLVVNLPLLFSSYLGDSGRNLLATFHEIEFQRAVVLFDEFDSIATSRSNPNDIGEIRRVVNTILTLLDDWQGSGLIIATTNNSADLDEAIWRRFDLSMEMPLPQFEDRQRLWQRYANGKLTRDQLLLVCEATKDWSPAEIKLLGQQAMRENILKGKPIFESIVRQLSWNQSGREQQRKLLVQLHNAAPKLSTRELSEIVGLSKSTVQRDLRDQED